MTKRRCEQWVEPRVSKGIRGKGTESFGGGRLRQCSRPAVDGDFLCAVHRRKTDQIQAALAKRKARKESK